MKKIDTSFDSSVLGRPFLSRSLDHVQQAYTEIVDALTKGLLGSYTTNDVIILYGCVFTGTDPGARTMTAGSIYYNGEVYLVSAASFTTTGSDIPLWTIVTTYPGADPVTFSDGSTTHNVHKIIKFVLVAGPVGGSGVTGYVADYTASKYYMDPTIYRDSSGTETFGSRTKNKVIEIGDWDMDTNSAKSVAHGISDFTKIETVTAFIRNDAATTARLLVSMTSVVDGTCNGGIDFDGTNVNLTRVNSGLFDSANYNSTSFNRGWITIQYRA